jgi:hypothetical protein
MTTSDELGAAYPQPSPDRVEQAIVAMRQRRAQLRRARIAGVAGLTVAAIVVAGAVQMSTSGRSRVVVSSATDTNSTSSGVSNGVTPISRSSIVAIENGNEGHSIRFSEDSHADGFRAALAQLPAELPAPTGSSTCDLGRTVVITLSSQQQLRYGPCVIPRAVNAALDAAVEVYEPGSAPIGAKIERAIEACRTAAPTGTLFSADFTTVGEIRRPASSPRERQIPNAFPTASDADFAAWCGRNLSDGTEQYYAIGPNNEVAVASQP